MVPTFINIYHLPMKTTKLVLTGLAAVAALLSNSFAQTTVAVTDPVGYITTDISREQAGAQTYAGPVLVNKVEMQGASTNAIGGTSSATFSSAVPTNVVAASYFAEVKSTGWWANIASVSGSTITTDSPFPAGLAIGTEIIIRKHVTVNEYLGSTNSSGLAELEDFVELLVLDSATQVKAPRSVVWVTLANGLPNGWYDFVSQQPVGDAVIFPGEAVRFNVKSAAAGNPLKLVTVGHVKTTPTKVGLAPGEQWLVVAGHATETSLVNSGLNTGSILTGVGQEDGNLTGDELNILLPSQSGESFVALTPALGGGWANFVSQQPADNQLIKEGAGFVLQRKAASGNGVWTVPAQIVQP